MDAKSNTERRVFESRSPWTVEPPVDELLGDPIAELLMRRDRVGDNEISRLTRIVQARRSGIGRPSVN